MQEPMQPRFSRASAGCTPAPLPPSKLSCRSPGQRTGPRVNKTWWLGQRLLLSHTQPALHAPIPNPSCFPSLVSLTASFCPPSEKQNTQRLPILDCSIQQASIVRTPLFLPLHDISGHADGTFQSASPNLFACAAIAIPWPFRFPSIRSILAFRR